MHTFTARTVAAARLFEASLYCGGALLLALVMVWLTASFGINWIIVLFDALLAFYAVGCFVKACEIYAASQQPERPDERQRYLNGRMLYNPDRQVQRGRRGKITGRLALVEAHGPWPTRGSPLVSPGFARCLGPAKQRQRRSAHAGARRVLACFVNGLI
jgi:hypothetical protein